ncbi:MAG: hypothetical protein ACPGRZ_15430 [Alphaproteobacteria bacterium]
MSGVSRIDIIKDYQKRLAITLSETARFNTLNFFSSLVGLGTDGASFSRTGGAGPLLGAGISALEVGSATRQFIEHYNFTVSEANSLVNAELIEAGYAPIRTLSHPLDLRQDGFYDESYVSLLKNFSQKSVLFSAISPEFRAARGNLKFSITQLENGFLPGQPEFTFNPAVEKILEWNISVFADGSVQEDIVRITDSSNTLTEVSSVRYKNGEEVFNNKYKEHLNTKEQVDAYSENGRFKFVSEPELAIEDKNGNLVVRKDPDPSCFVAGTPVDMADGSRKPIERIEIGDEVMAFDPYLNDGAGGRRPSRVTQTHATPNRVSSTFTARG